MAPTKKTPTKKKDVFSAPALQLKLQARRDKMKAMLADIDGQLKAAKKKK